MIKDVGIRVLFERLSFLQNGRAENKPVAQVLRDFTRSHVQRRAVPARTAKPNGG